MQAGVMDPNVSAADDILKDLSPIVPHPDMIFKASITDDEQPKLTYEQWLKIKSIENSMLTDDDDDHDAVDEHMRSLGSELPADSSPTPQDPADRGPQNNISNPRVEDRNYTKFTLEEVDKLIRAVDQHGRSWTKIRDEYFSESTRTTQQLKEKWRHMMDWKGTIKNPKTDQYMRAKDVDAKYGQDGRSSRFRNKN